MDGNPQKNESKNHKNSYKLNGKINSTQLKNQNQNHHQHPTENHTQPHSYQLTPTHLLKPFHLLPQQDHQIQHNTETQNSNQNPTELHKHTDTQNHQNSTTENNNISYGHNTQTTFLNDLHNVFSPLQPHELADLQSSISEKGIISPITTYKNHIIDGHHRLKIAQFLQLQHVPTLQLDPNTPIHQVQSLFVELNYARRQLSLKEKAKAAAILRKLIEQQKIQEITQKLNNLQNQNHLQTQKENDSHNSQNTNQNHTENSNQQPSNHTENTNNSESQQHSKNSQNSTETLDFLVFSTQTQSTEYNKSLDKLISNSPQKNTSHTTNTTQSTLYSTTQNQQSILAQREYLQKQIQSQLSQTQINSEAAERLNVSTRQFHRLQLAGNAPKSVANQIGETHGFTLSQAAKISKILNNHNDSDLQTQLQNAIQSYEQALTLQTQNPNSQLPQHTNFIEDSQKRILELINPPNPCADIPNSQTQAKTTSNSIFQENPTHTTNPQLPNHTNQGSIPPQNPNENYNKNQIQNTPQTHKYQRDPSTFLEAKIDSAKQRITILDHNQPNNPPILMLNLQPLSDLHTDQLIQRVQQAINTALDSLDEYTSAL